MTKFDASKISALRSDEYRSYRYDPDDGERRKAERERWQNRHAKQRTRMSFLRGDC